MIRGDMRTSPSPTCKMVLGAGLEPAQPYGRGILSPLRLPISPPERFGTEEAE